MKQNNLARWGALAIAASVTVPTFAQETRTETRREETRTEQRRTGEPNNAAVRELRDSDMPKNGIVTPEQNDKRICRWLAIDCKALTECAKMARAQAGNADVKAFAETLVADHTKCCDELGGGDAAGQANAGDRANRAAYTPKSDDPPRSGLNDQTRDKTRTAVVVQDDGKSRDNNIVFRATDFVAVKEDVCNRVKDAAKKEWEGVSGAEFDRAFLKHQVMGHECLIASMRAVRPTASSELQAKLDRGIETMTRHLESARKMCEQHKNAK